MAVVRILAVHLTGPGRQQVLQGPKTILDPVAPLPGPDEPRPADGRRHTEQVVQLHTGLMDDDEGHGAIRWTGGPQPYITYPRNLGTVTPEPIAGLLQVTPRDVPSVWERKDIRRFPFYEE